MSRAVRAHTLYYDLDEVASHLHWQLVSEVEYAFPPSYPGIGHPYSVARAVATELAIWFFDNKRLSLYVRTQSALSRPQSALSLDKVILEDINSPQVSRFTSPELGRPVLNHQVNYGSFSFAALARPVTGLLHQKNSTENPSSRPGSDASPQPELDPRPQPELDPRPQPELDPRPRPKRTVPAKRRATSIDDFIVGDDSSDPGSEKRARIDHVSDSEE
jgi:hypothetical protein